MSAAVVEPAGVEPPGPRARRRETAGAELRLIARDFLQGHDAEAAQRARAFAALLEGHGRGLP